MLYRIKSGANAGMIGRIKKMRHPAAIKYKTVIFYPKDTKHIEAIITTMDNIEVVKEK